MKADRGLTKASDLAALSPQPVYLKHPWTLQFLVLLPAPNCIFLSPMPPFDSAPRPMEEGKGAPKYVTKFHF